MVSIASLSLSQSEKKRLRNPAVGGVILFVRNYKDKMQLAQLISEIKSINETLIIAVDHEGGIVQRLKNWEFTYIPAAEKYGLYYDDASNEACQLAEATGVLAGSELKSVGIDCGFTPVLDLSNSKSKVIGSRAYHSNTEAVAMIAGSFIRGLRRSGIISVGKHYPGHGSVEGDTHTDCVIDPRPISEIYASDILPYRRLIQQDLLDAIMMAHVIYPAFDSVPASLSAKWMKQSLREDLKFNGTIFSDDVSMAGIGESSLSACKMLEAGCDMIIVCHNESLIEKLIQEMANYPLKQHRRKFQERWLTRQSNIAQIKTGQSESPDKLIQTKRKLSQLDQRYS